MQDNMMLDLTKYLLYITEKVCQKFGVTLNPINAAECASAIAQVTLGKVALDEEEDEDEDTDEEDEDEEESDNEDDFSSSKGAVSSNNNKSELSVKGNTINELSYLLSEKARITKPTEVVPFLKMSSPMPNKTPPRLPLAFLPPEHLSPPSAHIGAALGAEEDSVANSSLSSHSQGSRENPFVSFLNLSNPERNRDFCAVVANNMERQDSYHTGVVVSKHVMNLDEEDWSAEIPSRDEFPAYYERCMLIKRPSLDFIQRHPDIYHHKLTCAPTKMAHESVVGNKDKIDWIYYLVVFPDWIALDNTHFSGHVTSTVETKYNRVKLEHNHALNEFGKDFYYLYVYWEVALKHGGHKKPPAKKKVDKKKLYD